VLSTELGFLRTGQTTDLPSSGTAEGAVQVRETGALQYVASGLLRQGYLLTPLGSVGTLQAAGSTTGGLLAYTGSSCLDPGTFATGLTPNGALVCTAGPSLTFSSRVLLGQPSATFPSGVNLGALAPGVLTTSVSGGGATISTVPAPTSALVGVNDAQDLNNKRVNPRTVSLSNAATLTIDLSAAEVVIVNELLQPTFIDRPTGPLAPGQLIRLQLHSTLPRALTWEATWDDEVGFLLPTTTTGGDLYDNLWFQYNPSTGKLDLIFNSQLAALTVPTGVVPGTYACPTAISIDTHGRVASVTSGTCGGGGGGSAAAGGAGDVQYNNGSGGLAAETGNLTYDPATDTLVTPSVMTAQYSYYTFQDPSGYTGYLMMPPLTKNTGFILPSGGGDLCAPGGNCNVTVQEVDGTPSGKPSVLKFSNGSVTDNGDGSFTVTTGAGGGGDFSSNTSTSVDSEIVLFSGVGGKTGKRSTGTGFAKLTAGVLSTDSNTYVVDTGVQSLTSSTTYTCVRNGPTTQAVTNTCKMSMSGGASTVTLGTSGTLQDGDKFLLRLRCTVAAQTIAYAANIINSANVTAPTSCPLDSTKELMVGLLYSADTAKLQVIASTQ
jgi:hypothetical protein